MSTRTNDLGRTIIGALACAVAVSAGARDAQAGDKQVGADEGNLVYLMNRPDCPLTSIEMPKGTPLKVFHKPWPNALWQPTTVDWLKLPGDRRLTIPGSPKWLMYHTIVVFYDPNDPSKVTAIGEKIPRDSIPGAGPEEELYTNAPELSKPGGRPKGWFTYKPGHWKFQRLYHHLEENHLILGGEGVVENDHVKAEYALGEACCTNDGFEIPGKSIRNQRILGLNKIGYHIQPFTRALNDDYRAGMSLWNGGGSRLERSAGVAQVVTKGNVAVMFVPAGTRALTGLPDALSYGAVGWEQGGNIAASGASIFTDNETLTGIARTGGSAYGGAMMAEYGFTQATGMYLPRAISPMARTVQVVTRVKASPAGGVVGRASLWAAPVAVHFYILDEHIIDPMLPTVEAQANDFRTSRENYENFMELTSYGGLGAIWYGVKSIFGYR